MNFDLSEDQRAFEQSLLRWFSREFPLSAVREVFEGDTGRSDGLWKALADMGVFGIVVPEEYGGTGRELLDLALAAECLGYAAAPGPFVEHVLATLAITVGGDEAQRTRWLPGLADGTLRATIALGEESGGWLPEDWLLGSDEALTGTKRWVLNPSGADLLIVGVSDGFAVVEGDPGVTIEPLEVLDRTRRTAHVHFDASPAERLTFGSAAAPRTRDAALILLAADAVGVSRRCVEMAVEYAKGREQFGVTIGHFQALKHQLADLALEAEPMRGLYWYAAHAYDHVPDDGPKFAALAKAHTADRAVEIGRRTIEAHGGIGYTWEADAHFFLKRAVFDRAYFGKPALHRGRIAEMHGWSATAPPI